MDRAARYTAAAGVAATVASGSVHSSAAVKVAGALVAIGAGATAAAEFAHFPPELVWIIACGSGTMAGALATVLVSLIVSPKATKLHHLLWLLLAFVGGLVVSPLVADWFTPKTVPFAFYLFGLSGICAFVVPAGAIALHKRSPQIANSALDRACRLATARTPSVAPRRRGNGDE